MALVEGAWRAPFLSLTPSSCRPPSREPVVACFRRGFWRGKAVGDWGVRRYVLGKLWSETCQPLAASSLDLPSLLPEGGDEGI